MSKDEKRSLFSGVSPFMFNVFPPEKDTSKPNADQIHIGGKAFNELIDEAYANYCVYEQTLFRHSSGEKFSISVNCRGLPSEDVERIEKATHDFICIINEAHNKAAKTSGGGGDAAAM